LLRERSDPRPKIDWFTCNQPLRTASKNRPWWAPLRLIECISNARDKGRAVHSFGIRSGGWYCLIPHQQSRILRGVEISQRSLKDEA
jgi:hypothetical protein